MILFAEHDVSRTVSDPGQVTSISGFHVAAGEADAVINLRNGLVGKVAKASATTGATTTLISWSANVSGIFGNSIKVTLSDPVGNNQPLGVTVTGTEIDVSLATGPSGTLTSTAQQVVAAVRAATTLVSVSAEGNGVLGAVGETTFTGGLGDPGPILVSVAVPQGTSTHFSSSRPVPFGNGVYVEVEAACAAGSVVPG